MQNTSCGTAQNPPSPYIREVNFCNINVHHNLIQFHIRLHPCGNGHTLSRRTPKLALGGGTQVQQTLLLSFRHMNDVPNESPFAEIPKQLHTANYAGYDDDGIHSYP